MPSWATSGIAWSTCSGCNPLLLAPMGAALVIDSVSTFRWCAIRGQAAKLGQRLSPMIVRPRHPSVASGRVRPRRSCAPGAAGASSTSWPSTEVPTFVLHGDRDLIVPLATARSAAKRSNGQLITVKGAAHSWMLRDPETLPAIVAELLPGRLGSAIREAIGAAGATSTDELESIFYEPDAPILALTPAPTDEASSERPDTDRPGTAGPSPDPIFGELVLHQGPMDPQTRTSSVGVKPPAGPGHGGSVGGP